jgi:dTDP-4-amino-4,6-dideoxy-D-glucose acyltransferase
MAADYTQEALDELGFISLGEGVRIHQTVLFWGAGNISIGLNVRIDANCVITAGPENVCIGDYVHIGVGCSIFGTAGTTLGDFCTLSGRVSIYSTNDDYSGASLTNPTVPDEFRNVDSAPVRIEKHGIVGCGSVVMPGVHLEIGAAVGALSYVNESVTPFTIVAGTPARKTGDRKRDLLDLEKRLLGKTGCDSANE